MPHGYLTVGFTPHGYLKIGFIPYGYLKFGFMPYGYLKVLILTHLSYSTVWSIELKYNFSV